MCNVFSKFQHNVNRIHFIDWRGVQMEKKTTLLIMAAGIGSRFGGGIKQLAPVDEDNHIIMDYSIHDAEYSGCF